MTVQKRKFQFIKNIYDESMGTSIRKLEIFAAVARLGSVTRAAGSLYLSQPAVSMALADLEDRQGGPLFVRRGRRLTLNDRGRLLLPLAEEIVRKAGIFEQILEDNAPEPTGRLRLGASTTIGNYLLPLLMAKFSRRYPRAGIQLTVGNTDQMARALDRGELDLALIEGPCPVPSLTMHRWRDDDLVIVVGRDHPWAVKKRVGKKDLPAADWILREVGSGTRQVFELALGRPLDDLPSIVELGHTEAIKKAVEAGLGVGCLSRLAVRRELDHGWLVEVRTPLVLLRPLTILLPGADPPSRLLAACLEMLAAEEDPGGAA